MLNIISKFAVIMFILMPMLFAWAQHGDPNNVLVVVNANSAVSQAIGSYYASKRKIPSTNIVSISTQDCSSNRALEEITYNNFSSQIYSPLINAVYTRPHIRYIVLTKGIPIRITGHPSLGCNYGKPNRQPSVDSILASMGITYGYSTATDMKIHFADKNGSYGYAWVNNYWGQSVPFERSKHKGYLVTRLDGYTETDAKALVDRSLNCRPPTGEVVLDTSGSTSEGGHGFSDPALQPEWVRLPTGTPNPNYNYNFDDFNADMVKASQELSVLLPASQVVLDMTSAIIGGKSNLFAHISWGSNDPQFWKNPVFNFTLAQGSLAVQAVSYCGETFIPNPSPPSGQSQTAVLIKRGVAGAQCFVQEPFIDAVASPTYLLKHYVKGHNLAEAFYSAIRFVGWEDIILGDPLCRPFGATLYGTIHFQDFNGSPSALKLNLSLKRSNSEWILYQNQPMDANGKYSISLYQASKSHYDYYEYKLKANHWLSVGLRQVDLLDYIKMDYSFINGDVNGDDHIDDIDLYCINSEANNMQSGLHGFTDLNHDGVVDKDDVNIVTKNIGKSGGVPEY